MRRSDTTLIDVFFGRLLLTVSGFPTPSCRDNSVPKAEYETMKLTWVKLSAIARVKDAMGFSRRNLAYICLQSGQIPLTGSDSETC